MSDFEEGTLSKTEFGDRHEVALFYPPLIRKEAKPTTIRKWKTAMMFSLNRLGAEVTGHIGILDGYSAVRRSRDNLLRSLSPGDNFFD